MFFWEFTVLLRKVLLLGVALFWEDAFLQSVVGIFVLMLSIVTHMACWPYNEAFLNIAELCTLISLFTMVALSILLWYVQQRSDSVELYELLGSCHCVIHSLLCCLSSSFVMKIGCDGTIDKEGITETMLETMRPFRVPADPWRRTSIERRNRGISWENCVEYLDS